MMFMCDGTECEDLQQGDHIILPIIHSMRRVKNEIAKLKDERSLLEKRWQELVHKDQLSRDESKEKTRIEKTIVQLGYKIAGMQHNFKMMNKELTDTL